MITKIENVESYLPLAKKVAKQIANRYWNSILDESDYVSIAMTGILDAAKRFDPEKQPSFERFAYLRARGAIIDELRRLDWVPASRRRNHKGRQQELPNIKTSSIISSDKLNNVIEHNYKCYEEELEMEDAITFIFRGLVPSRRVYAKMHYIEGMSIKEIARSNDITEIRMHQIFHSEIKPSVYERAALYRAQSHA